MTEPALLVRGARVLRQGADPHHPSPADVLIRGDRIAGVAGPGDPPLLEPGMEMLEAGGKLLIPGLVSAHYHSHDTLLKGRFEDMPLDVWVLHAQPAYWGARTRQEVRLRTLLGAMEALKAGITTVQDMNSMVPQDEETLDTILSAYAECGIRVVFSVALRDLPDLDIAPLLPADLPPEVARLIGGAPRDPDEDLAFVAAQIRRLRPLPPRLHWALSPSSPQRASRRLLEGLAGLSEAQGLPVLTHAYETRAQLAKARRTCPDGSVITYLRDVGLLTPRTTLAHAVHVTDAEIEAIARAGVGVVLNPVSNLKLKNGVAPVAAFHRAGVPLALGCDNNSCSDCQNLFQAMKLATLIAAGSDAKPTGMLACDAVAAATVGGARAVGLAGEVGAIAPGMKADLVLLDLEDLAWQPFASASRQLVYSETGRAVHTVLVDGRIVLRAGQMTTVDEAAFRAELAEVMQAVEHDLGVLSRRVAPAVPPLLEANAALSHHALGMDRLLPG
jgi:5-methylthioadenosine/S-adenosylhomocysteine deaminase